eukprot:14348543-Ditylum_brightwellii.AAC.1
MESIEQLTTLAQEYLDTVLSNRERNKLQRQLAKKETKMTTKTGSDKIDTSTPQCGTSGGTQGGTRG